MFKDRLVEVFSNNGIILNDIQIDSFVRYRDMLLEYNDIHNLTSITDDEGVICKHFLDSVLPYREFQDNSTIIDIGTGAGFPSIPLMIMNNTFKFVLVDSVDKKLTFVRSVCEKLCLNADVIHSRVEDLANNNDYRESFDYVVARAVASLSTLMEYSIPFLKVDGALMCYKGTNYIEEIESSPNAFKVLHAKLDNVYDYYVSELDTTRYVLKVTKISDTDKKYPRGMNKPRLKPLG